MLRREWRRTPCTADGPIPHQARLCQLGLHAWPSHLSGQYNFWPRVSEHLDNRTVHAGTMCVWRVCGPEQLAAELRGGVPLLDRLWRQPLPTFSRSLNKHDSTPLDAKVRVSGNGTFWLTPTKPVPNDGDVVHVTLGRVSTSYRVSNMRNGRQSCDRKDLGVGELFEIMDPDEVPRFPR